MSAASPSRSPTGSSGSSQQGPNGAPATPLTRSHWAATPEPYALSVDRRIRAAVALSLAILLTACAQTPTAVVSTESPTPIPTIEATPTPTEEPTPPPSPTPVPTIAPPPVRTPKPRPSTNIAGQ